MPRTLFSRIALRGPVVDAADQVPDNAPLQLRVYAEPGNGAGNNGGADAAWGLPDVAACVDAAGTVLDSVAVLIRQDGGGLTPTPLQLLAFYGPELAPGPQRVPLYVDLFFRPLGEGVRLLAAHAYTLDYTGYLPVAWTGEDAVFTPPALS